MFRLQFFSGSKQFPLRYIVVMFYIISSLGDFSVAGSNNLRNLSGTRLSTTNRLSALLLCCTPPSMCFCILGAVCSLRCVWVTGRCVRDMRDEVFVCECVLSGGWVTRCVLLLCTSSGCCSRLCDSPLDFLFGLSLLFVGGNRKCINDYHLCCCCWIQSVFPSLFWRMVWDWMFSLSCFLF